MNKSKSLKIALYVRVAGILLLFACFFIPFAAALTLSSGSVHTTYGSFFSFIFSGNISNGKVSYAAKGLSVLCLIGFIFLCVAFVLLVSTLFIKKNTSVLKALLVLASILLVITSAILLVSSHKSLATVLADTLIKGHSDSVTTTVYNNTSIQFGVWGTATFEFLSSLCLLSSLLLDGSFDRIRAKIGLFQIKGQYHFLFCKTYRLSKNLNHNPFCLFYIRLSPE